MAKTTDKKLFGRLRATGLRERARKLVDDLEDRARGGPGKRSKAAKKAAATRKREAARRSAAAKKGARTRARAGR